MNRRSPQKDHEAITRPMANGHEKNIPMGTAPIVTRTASCTAHLLMLNIASI